MDSKAQASSDDEDEGHPVTSQMFSRKVSKQVLEEEEEEAPNQPAFSPWHLLSPEAGLRPTVALPKPRLSTIWASESEGSSGHLGSNSGPGAYGKDPPVPDLDTSQQQGEPPETRRQPRRQRLPGIRDTTGRRRRRDQKKLAAVAERVRQWEYWLLQNIEEATQHELTIEESQ